MPVPATGSDLDGSLASLERVLCDIGAVQLRLNALAGRSGEHERNTVPPKKRPKTPNSSNTSVVNLHERLLQQQRINLKVIQELVSRLLNHLGVLTEPTCANLNQHSAIGIGYLQRLINVHLHARALCCGNSPTASDTSVDSLEPLTLKLLALDGEPLTRKRSSAMFRQNVIQHVWHLLHQGFICAPSQKRLDPLQVQALAAIAEGLARFDDGDNRSALPVFFRKPGSFLSRMLADAQVYLDMGALGRIIQLTAALVQARLKAYKHTTGLVRVRCFNCSANQNYSASTAPVNSCRFVDLPCRFVNVCIWLAHRASKLSGEHTTWSRAAAVNSVVIALFGNVASLQFCNRACGMPPLVGSSDLHATWGLPRPVAWVAFELLRMESTTHQAEGEINDVMQPFEFDEWVRSFFRTMATHNREGSAGLQLLNRALFAFIRIACLGIRERAIADRWNQPQLMFLFRVIAILLETVEASACSDVSTSSKDGTGSAGALHFCLQQFWTDFCDGSNAGVARTPRHWQWKSFQLICRLFAGPIRSSRVPLSSDAATQLLSLFESHFLSLQPWPIEAIDLVAEAALNVPAHNRPQHILCEITMSLATADAALTKYSDLQILPLAALAHRLTRAAAQTSGMGGNPSPTETAQDDHNSSEIDSSFAVTACVLHWCHYQLWRSGIELTTVDDAADSPQCRNAVKVVLGCVSSDDVLLGIARSSLGFSAVEICATPPPAKAQATDHLRGSDMELTKNLALQFANSDQCWTHPRASAVFQIFFASAIARHSPSVLLQLLTSLSPAHAKGSASPSTSHSMVVVSAGDNTGVPQLTRLFHVLLLVGGPGVMAAFRLASAEVQRNMATVFSTGAALLGLLQGNSFGPCESLCLQKRDARER